LIIVLNHLFEKNIINSPSRSVTSRQNSNAVFLCNKFENAPSFNFSWEGVNLFQGFGKDPTDPLSTEKPAGNIFSDLTLLEVTGNSNINGSDVTYLHNVNKQDEILDKSDNDGVKAIDLVETAPCGLIGPNWIYVGQEGCPSGIDCNQPCPTGIDCTQPCPSGIDCTQPCPFGIDCTQPCPPGIDCNEPCPPNVNCFKCPNGIDCSIQCPTGIDCTQPCPPGIDCTQPCPPGIDCTQPCPVGMDCTKPCAEGMDCSLPCPLERNCEPILLPLHDPVMAMVETQYQQLILEEEYYTNSIFNFDDQTEELIFDITRVSKDKLLKKVLIEKNIVTFNNMKQLFKSSKLFTEQEFVEILKSNPASLFEKNINRKIFQSKSFSDKNLQDLRNTFNTYSNSSEVGEIWALESIRREKNELIQYALERLRHYGNNSLDEQYIWYQRLKDISALLTIMDNYFRNQNHNKVSEIINYILNQDFKNYEIQDALEYKLLLDLFKNAAENGRNYSSLTDSEINYLNNITQSNNRYTRAKAVAILSTYYNLDSNQFNPLPDYIEPLEFIKQTTSTYQDDLNQVKIYPNPSKGILIIENNYLNSVKFKIYNTTGSLVFETILDARKEQSINTELENGMYNYIIHDEKLNILTTDRLIIMK